MKKLIMAFAVAACATMAQASVVKWSSGTVTFGGTKLGNQTVSLYLVGVSGQADVLFDTRTTANAPAAKKGQLSSDVGTGQAAYDYNSTLAGGGFVTGGGTDAGREYYMVITYNDGTKDYTYTSSAVASTGLTSTSLGSVAFTFTDTTSTVAGTKNAWVAAPVPEPTSGLLVLVGFGALALRRRRA